MLISTTRGYFAQTLDSERLSRQTILEADTYLPEHLFIDQRIQDSSQVRASEYLGQSRLASGEAPLLVVLAPAGHGKTSLVMQFARTLAQRHLDSVDAPVPFLISLHRHKRVQNFEELILTHLEDRNVHGITSTSVNAHQASYSSGELPALEATIDGIDSDDANGPAVELRNMLLGVG